MKPKYIAVVAALAAIVVQSALAGSLPEIMTPGELRALRAGQIARAAAAQADVAKSETPTLYTGKISDADSGGYLFKYRNYDPELSRWMTVDPSGFPDGVNCNSYAPNPLSEVDWCGLIGVYVWGYPTTTNISPSPLGITIVDEAERVGDAVQAKMVTDWTYSGQGTGFAVQHIQLQWNIYNQSDNSVFRQEGLEYWEAWHYGMTNTFSYGGRDTYLSASFPTSTYGSFTVTGTAKFFTTQEVSSSSPSFWGQVSVNGWMPALDLKSTQQQPSWWSTSGALSHDMQISWWE